MKNSTLYIMLGLSGLFAVANSANAAPVNLAVTIQQTNEDGSLFDITPTRIWTPNLTDSALWSTSTVDGHEINDLVSESMKWRNVSGLAWDSAAVINVNDLKFDMDPMLSFDFTLSNNTAFNQTYSIYYNTPLAPTLTGTVNSSSNLTAVLTDVAGNAGAKISPLSGGYILRSFDLTENGTEISKNVDVGNTFSIASGVGTKNWSAVNTLVCGSGEFACETMSAVLTLTLSKGDKVRLYGEVEQIEAVPLPSSALLLGSMLGLLATLRRSKKQM